MRDAASEFSDVEVATHAAALRRSLEDVSAQAAALRADEPELSPTGPPAAHAEHFKRLFKVRLTPLVLFNVAHLAAASAFHRNRRQRPRS